MPTHPAVVGIASRAGTVGTNADAAHAWTASTPATGAAVIDGIGHSEELHALVPVLAVTAARLAALSWPPAGLLTAGRMLCDPGHDGSAPDAVGIAACVRPGSRSWIAWAGDCRGYGWDPDAQVLTRYTVDATAAAYLAAHGVDPETARQHSGRLRQVLSEVVPGSVHEAVVPAGHTIILTSDGVHDQITPKALEALVRTHQDDPRHLAAALVAAARPDGTGYRDDATALIIRPPRTPSNS
ncbi:SpoIIE family protein phosphatase [Streptomyces sp. NPDC002602]|uniref:SpoIIE family protein phosphatase n=1 Tax=Streptomyces sp. NPDC002602 TaxID=3364654 RepID=UPI0036AF927E